MKNLTLYNQEIREISKREFSTDGNHYCIDPDNDDFYIGTENNFYHIPSDSEKTEHALNSDHCCQIIGIFTFMNRIYYASDNGNLFCFDILDPENFIFYEELNVDLHCMSISPDMDIIVVVTKTGEIVTLDLSLEVLSKVIFQCKNFTIKFLYFIYLNIFNTLIYLLSLWFFTVLYLGGFIFIGFWRKTIRNCWLGKKGDTVSWNRGESGGKNKANCL